MCPAGTWWVMWTGTICSHATHTATSKLKETLTCPGMYPYFPNAVDSLSTPPPPLDDVSRIIGPMTYVAMTSCLANSFRKCATKSRLFVSHAMQREIWCITSHRKSSTNADTHEGDDVLINTSCDDTSSEIPGLHQYACVSCTTVHSTASLVSGSLAAS